MKRGETVFLIRPKRKLMASVLSDHAPFPAVTIQQRGHPKIVHRKEVMTAEEYEAQRAEKVKEQAMLDLADFLASWEPHATWRELGEKMGLPAGAVWHMHQKARRLGII